MQSFVLSYRLSEKPRSYKLFYGSFNPNEHPNFATEVLTPEGIAKYKKLETAFHFKTGFVQIHCNKDALYILVTYRNQPRIFRLRSPPPSLQQIMDVLPTTTARALLAAYVVRFPHTKQFFPHSVQLEVESPNGLVQEYTKFQLTLIDRTPFLQIFPDQNDWWDPTPDE